MLPMQVIMAPQGRLSAPSFGPVFYAPIPNVPHGAPRSGETGAPWMVDEPGLSLVRSSPNGEPGIRTQKLPNVLGLEG